MSQIEIFDKNIVKIHRKRVKPGNRSLDFLINEGAVMLDECLLDIDRKFEIVFEIDRFMEILPNERHVYELVKSSLHLHFINDLPGVLLQARRMLKPDGFFIANMFGGDTLKELRECFAEADPDSISPRISPMLDVRDGGALLQRAGFNLPVADVETIEVTYETPFHLMKHLRKIGETNALIRQRKNFTSKTFMHRVAEIYAEKFTDEEGRVKATFEIITLSGWKPDASQQLPLARGSAKKSFSDALE